MTYSNKLKLDEIISQIDVEYVVMKLPEYFPNYNDFSDLDILIHEKDIQQIIETISTELSNYSGTYKILDTNGHIQIDYYEKDHKRLNFKFDFLYNLDKAYKKSKFNELFLLEIFNDKIEYNSIYIPTLKHELIIRWVEYYEYINIRQDKIKHLNYISLWKDDFNINELKKEYLL